MAAYDVFQRDKLKAWAMQKFGAFSVDRDGSDRASMKFAMDILKEGRYALTIFPEGNVYFMNDRACPFLDGASFIALKSQKDLGPGRKVYVVPLSTKVTHCTDQRGAVLEKVSILADKTGVELNPSVDLRVDLMRIGEKALRLRLESLGYRPRGSESMELGPFLHASAHRIIERLEKSMELKVRAKDSTEDRIRRIRSQIHQIRTDPEKDAQCPDATHWAEEAILAMRVLSYTSHYIEDKPTLDRYAETVEKLTEDFFGELQRPWASRHVFSCVNQPIDLTNYLEAYQAESRATMEQLTKACEQAVQAGLDEMNALNTLPGAELF